MNPDEAEVTALRALGWILGDDELRGVFMGATGIDSDTLRSGATDPDIMIAVLDFIAMDDAWVLAFAEAANIAPEAILSARAALPGGALPNWT